MPRCTLDNTATALWVGIAAGVVILIGLAAFLLGQRGGSGVVHIPVPQPQPPMQAGPVHDDELVIDEDEDDAALADTYTEGNWLDDQD